MAWTASTTSGGHHRAGHRRAGHHRAGHHRAGHRRAGPARQSGGVGVAGRGRPRPATLPAERYVLAI
ncbi:MAG TPA: hypothetical protein VMK84_00300 [Streptosporangiaceae bacterium]|nr:hypothetical protein [Streptosporangiaceae bacterium]